MKIEQDASMMTDDEQAELSATCESIIEKSSEYAGTLICMAEEAIHNGNTDYIRAASQVERLFAALRFSIDEGLLVCCILAARGAAQRGRDAIQQEIAHCEDYSTITSNGVGFATTVLVAQLEAFEQLYPTKEERAAALEPINRYMNSFIEAVNESRKSTKQ